MKYSALNVDFSSLSPDPLDLKQKTCARGYQRGIPF